MHASEPKAQYMAFETLRLAKTMTQETFKQNTEALHPFFVGDINARLRL
jgi:hypothetical protein